MLIEVVAGRVLAAHAFRDIPEPSLDDVRRSFLVAVVTACRDSRLDGQPEEAPRPS
jgi:hypothetical protein